MSDILVFCVLRTQSLSLFFQDSLEIDAINVEGSTHLLHAAKQNDTTMVVRLLRFGANPQIADAIGVTPLHAASNRGNLEIVRALIKHRPAVDVNATSLEGFVIRACIKYVLICV